MQLLASLEPPKFRSEGRRHLDPRSRMVPTPGYSRALRCAPVLVPRRPRALCDPAPSYSAVLLVMRFVSSVPSEFMT